MASILIVDDDLGMVETLADIFSARRYEVSTARTGEHAIVMVQRHPIDVVLMDIKMPGINGVEALRAMKRLVPHLKVIMMTAFTRDELAQDARRATAVAVVPKPLDVDRVLTLVEGVSGAPDAGPGV